MSAVKRRKQKLGAGDRAFNIVLGGLTAVSVVVILYPLIFVLVASISDPMEIFQGNVWLWPKGFNLEAYKQVFRNGDIFTGYKNTLIYTVVGTLVTIIITFSAAYPLSRKKLYGRSKLMGFFLFTMFFSGGMIPTYLMVKNLGLYNTMWAVILVGTVSVYNIIVARTFMLDTAAATGRTLGVIFQNRYNAGSQLIRRCLDNGDLGEVRAARVLLTWDRSPEYYSQSDWKGTWDKEGGGVIIDQAIHTLDLMRWFIGRPVTGVQASLANRTHPDIPVEDTAEGRVEFEGGAYGAFYVMNHYCTDEPVRLELACTRGKAVMEGPKARVELNNGLTCLADNDPTQMFEYGDVKQYWGTSHVKQIGNFYQSLLGLAPMYVTAENAFLTQEMICALYEHGRRHFVREVR